MNIPVSSRLLKTFMRYRGNKLSKWTAYAEGGGGVGGSTPSPHWTYINFSTNCKLLLSPFNIDENQENALLQLNMQFLSSWNDCRRQFNCRHHAMINDICTKSMKLNKFATSFGRPGPKKAPASGRVSTPGSRWALCQTPVIISRSPCHTQTKLNQCNPLHCEILCTPMKERPKTCLRRHTQALFAGPLFCIFSHAATPWYVTCWLYIMWTVWF